jgi:predicted negative regulator of RcsB-dependent stress response
MTEHSVFSKKHAVTMAQDKRAILEELNLPPVAIDFIRANAKTIQIVIAVAVVVILGWEGYGKYTAVQRDRSADMLYQAMKAGAAEQQTTQLKELFAKYGKQGSGRWGIVEQGHLAFKEGKFQEAATQYQAVLASIDNKNPLYPLIQYNLAQAYENLPDQAKAKAAYQALAEVQGFAGEASLGLARLAEQEGKKDEALAKYKEFVDLPETKDGPTKEWATNKVLTLTPKKAK